MSRGFGLDDPYEREADLMRALYDKDLEIVEFRQELGRMHVRLLQATGGVLDLGHCKAGQRLGVDVWWSTDTGTYVYRYIGADGSWYDGEWMLPS